MARTSSRPSFARRIAAARPRSKEARRTLVTPFDVSEKASGPRYPGRPMTEFAALS